MRLAPLTRLMALVLLAGCGGAHPNDAGVEATLAPLLVAAVPSTPAPLPLESPQATLERDLCPRAIERDRQPEPAGDADTKCAVAKLREVGESTYVALLYRGPEAWKVDGSEAAERGMTSDGNTDTFEVRFDRCEPFEYWLASVADGKLTKAQLVTAICNDGHGAAGVGEDSVSVTANTIAVATSGGSSWRWGHREVFSLPDLTLLSDSHNGYWSVSSNSEHTEWSWTERRGKSLWEAPRCSTGTADPPSVSFSHALVPAFERAPVFDGDGWKNARSIEGCATTLDGELVGEALSGVASPASARLSLVVANDQLYVELHDDKLVTRGNVRDELEVWHRQEPSGDWSAQCLEEPAPASGTAIRMGDLSTRILGREKRTPLSVEQAPARDGAPLRLRVPLPAKTRAVTVVYRDTDDGKRHSLVLASSTLEANDDKTLGVLHRIDPERASCQLVDDALVLRMIPHTEPDVAISQN